MLPWTMEMSVLVFGSIDSNNSQFHLHTSPDPYISSLVWPHNWRCHLCSFFSTLALKNLKLCPQPEPVQNCILPHSETGPLDPSSASFRGEAARRRPGAGLVCLALSYQPLRLCIQSVAAPTSAAAAAAFSDGKHCFSSGFKDRSLKGPASFCAIR